MIIKIEKSLLLKPFRLARRSPKHPRVDDRNKGRLYFQLGTVFTLLFFIILAVTFQEKREAVEAPYVPTDFVLTVTDVPETKQSQMPPPPPRIPAVPVESEEIDEELEEIVLEVDEFMFYNIPEMPKMEAGSADVVVGPRQLVLKIPEYPDSEKKKGREGIIDLRIKVDENGFVIDVEIVKNTTKSKILEESVKKAAYKCRYKPARDRKNRTIATWTSHTYTFEVKGI